MSEQRLRIEKPKTEAGGLPSVFTALKHIQQEAGWITGTRSLLQVNQFDGFDCPGCAWPDPDQKRSAFEFCENGAKAVAEEATDALCDEVFFRAHAISEMAKWSDYEIGKSGRIARPMFRAADSDHYVPVSWADALAHIGSKIRSLPSPHEAVFYTSGRTSNEAAFLYQLFVRRLGTNNLPDCSNMCHESSGVALTETLGIGKGTVTLDDFGKAELIVIMGQNPGTNHPRMLTALQDAKKQGARVISINPLPEAGLISFRHPQHPVDLLGKPTAIADLWLPVRINEDVALLKALLKMLLAREEQTPGAVLDHDFIATKTDGFQSLVADLKTYALPDLIAKSGVPTAKVEIAAQWLAETKRIIVCWAMGLTQHLNAVDNIREIINLLLLKGSIGKPGAGTCPVRGHSNVQGDRTMGIYEKPKADFLDSLQKNFQFEPPRAAGYDTVESIAAMAAGRVKVFVAMGGNFLSAAPDTDFTGRALANCELTVQISTKLNRSHLITGREAFILPCLGRTEKDEQAGGAQFVTVENSAGVVHRSQGHKRVASAHLWSEPKIVAGLAKATFRGTDGMNWDFLISDYDHIRSAIEKTIPGFENYNVRVRQPGGFYLPNAAREGVFHTGTRTARFTVNALAQHMLLDDELLLMTIRSHDQFNTTIYGLDDRYRGIRGGRRVVFMNEKDVVRFGFREGERVNLQSNYDGVTRIAEDFVVVPYPIPPQNLATYFPEANALVPHNHFARESQTPISKSVVVRVVRAVSR